MAALWLNGMPLLLLIGGFFILYFITFMEIISKYFPDLSATQRAQFEQLLPLYSDWNAKINVISRKDIDNLYLHHVLHSLAIAKLCRFKPFTQFLDIGTGGGFPGIPLAILLPECRFHLIDGTGKKIMVCKAVIEALGLTNARAEQLRAEQLHQKTYDYVISRATLPLAELFHFAQRMVIPSKSGEKYNKLPNGVLLLKGGNLREEIVAVNKKVQQYFLGDYFEEEYFAEKYLLHVRV